MSKVHTLRRVKRHMGKYARTHLVSIPLIALLLVLSAAYIDQSRRAFVSSEVDFADSSASGLSIVPASCDSNPPYEHYPGQCSSPGTTSACPTNADWSDGSNLAYRENAGDTNRLMTRYTSICVSNYSGNTYFVPANQQVEINSFIANPPPGVTVQNL